mgnify:CR=1 FL=1
MTTLSLASPFWEDPSTLTVEGHDSAAVLQIVAGALLAADYDIQVRDADGDLVPWDEWDEEDDDA